MTWLAWRQFRGQALAAAAGLAGLALVLVLVARASGLEEVGDQLLARLGSSQRLFYSLGTIVLLLLPAAVGAFWGAPLVSRELESGTHRLAWSQTISRNRWLGVKLALGTLAAALLVGLASLCLTWWCQPIDSAITSGGDRGGLFVARVAPLVFEARGIVPVGHAVFAFVLGVAVGLLVRRVLPAMAVTLAVLGVVLVATPLVLRPHLMPPAHQVAAIPLDAPVVLGGSAVVVDVHTPGDWQLSQQTVGPDGAPAALPAWFGGCAEHAVGEPRACLALLGQAGYRQEVTLQPGARFWQLQWRETALFLALGVALSAACFWRIQRA